MTLSSPQRYRTVNEKDRENRWCLIFVFAIAVG